MINDAWKRIADTLSIPIHELKEKKESLMTTFKLNLKKKLLSLKSGAGEENTYKTIWLFYDVLEEFLRDVYERPSLLNTEQDILPHSEQEAVDNNGLNSMVNSSVSGVQTGNSLSEAGNSAPAASSQNIIVAPKRRAKNPPELEEASKVMATAFTTLNNALNSKQDKEKEDECDLFCKLLSTMIKEYPKAEREDIMYEIHGLMMNKRRRRNEMMQRNSYFVSSPQIILSRPTSSHSRPTSSQNSYNIQSPSPGSMINSTYSTESFLQNYVNYQSPDSNVQETNIPVLQIQDNVQILTQETLQQRSNILLEAFENSTNVN